MKLDPTIGFVMREKQNVQDWTQDSVYEGQAEGSLSDSTS